MNVVTFASQPEKHGHVFKGEWVTNCDQKELLDCYAAWEPEVENLLKVNNSYLSMLFTICLRSHVEH